MGTWELEAFEWPMKHCHGKIDERVLCICIRHLCTRKWAINSAKDVYMLVYTDN